MSVSQDRNKGLGLSNQFPHLEVYPDKQIDLSFSSRTDHSQIVVIQVKMDEAATKTLVFYVNGKKVIDSNPDPGETLLTYLRNKLRSTSTSFSFSLIINSIK